MSIGDRMQRRMDRRDFKNYIPASPEDVKYYEALKRVKRIKGFYTHLVIYIVINIIILISNYQQLEPKESWLHASAVFVNDQVSI